MAGLENRNQNTMTLEVGIKTFLTTTNPKSIPTQNDFQIVAIHFNSMAIGVGNAFTSTVVRQG